MSAQIVQDETSFRIRHLLPAPLRRRYRLGLAATAAAVVVLLTTMALMPRLAGATVNVLLALGLLVCAVAAWGIWPYLMLRRRRPWSLVLDASGIDTWTAPYPAGVLQHLDWDSCHGVLAHAVLVEERRLVLLGFHGSDHLARPDQLPERRMLIVPTRRGLTLVDAAVAWLRSRRPDLPVTVTEAARELGVHP